LLYNTGGQESGIHRHFTLLNDTVGGSARSSEEENLLSRIYRKWQHALPIYNAFHGSRRKKGYEEGIGRAYPYTETEKDIWANLFEYRCGLILTVVRDQLSRDRYINALRKAGLR